MEDIPCPLCGSREGQLLFMGRDRLLHGPGSIDAVTMWDVLEHVPQPRQDLALVRRALRSSGTLVLSLPNIDSFSARMFGPYWAGWEVPRHMSFFNPKQIERLLSESGFSV